MHLLLLALMGHFSRLYMCSQSNFLDMWRANSFPCYPNGSKPACSLTSSSISTVVWVINCQGSLCNGVSPTLTTEPFHIHTASFNFNKMTKNDDGHTQRMLWAVITTPLRSFSSGSWLPLHIASGMASLLASLHWVVLLLSSPLELPIKIVLT